MPAALDLFVVGDPADPYQKAFSDALFTPDEAPPEPLARANGGRVDEAFNVYRNNVAVSLAEAVRAAYPVTSQLLGEGLSKQIGLAFARAHPPRSPVMALYGEGFEAFLANHPVAKQKPFLVDMARLEWAWREAYHTAAAAPLTLGMLAAADPEKLDGMRLVPHPAARLIGSRFPVGTIYAIESGISDADPQTVDLRRAETVLVVRPEIKVGVHLISEGGARFFKASADGTSLGDAAAMAMDIEPDFDLGGFFAFALPAGAFSRLDHMEQKRAQP